MWEEIQSLKRELVEEKEAAVDDGICASSSQTEAVKNRVTVISDLKNAGFVLNMFLNPIWSLCNILHGSISM